MFTKKILLLVLYLFTSSAFAQLTWEQTKGPYGGYFQDIKIDKNGRIYVAAMGGLVRSDDNGKTWQNEKLVSFGGPSTYVVYPHPSGKVLAGLGSNLMGTDFTGKNWKFIYNDIWTWDIKTDKTNNLLMVSNKGVFISRDTAKTWSSFLKFQYPVFDYTTIEDSLFFATSSQGVYISRNNGKTWALENLGLGQNLWWVKIISDSKNNIYIFSKNVLLKSIDKGLSWIRSQIPFTFINTVTINDKDEIFVTGDSGLFSSKDFGNSWINQNFAEDVNCFYESANGDKYIGTDAHLYKRSFGSNDWFIADVGILKSDISSIKINNNNLYVIANNEFCYSSDYGESWANFLDEGNYFKKIFCVDKKGRVVIGFKDKIVFTTDNGITWNNIKTGEIEPGDKNNPIFSIIIDSRDRIYFSTHKEIYKSDDFGESWTKIWSSNDIGNGILEFDNSENLYFTHGGELYMYSRDEGKIILVNNFHKGIYMIAFSPFGHVYVNADFKIYMRGLNNNWNFIHDVYSSIASIYFSSTGELYLWDMWLYKSKDFGLNFIEVPTPLITGFYRTGFTLSNNGYLFFATQVEGLFKTKVNSEAILKPQSLVMHNNFPNPFNNQTIIEFENPVQKLVELTIYDLLGRQIEKLVNEILPMGYYKYTWQPQNLASGIYFYKLQTPTSSETKKMILLK